MSRDALDAIRAAAPAVLPSLLMCDFGDLKGEVSRLADAGAKVLHLDVMDGQFVSNLTYGMPIVAGLRRHTDMPLDVHLMISDPLKYAQPMVDAGADMLTFHVEAVPDAVETAGRIRDMGVAVGIALNPETAIETIEPCLPSVDLALVMSVKAGFGGQKFNPGALDKLNHLRDRNRDLLLEIDGGIDATTIGPARQSGCDLFVVGSAIFRPNLGDQTPNYGQAMTDLTAAIAAVGNTDGVTQ